MNYFNYFTEIEEEFVRRRGSHMLISPMDWALIETWRQRGVPLRVALRAINQSFDAWEQRPRRTTRKVNSLFYCQQAVEEAFEQYIESRVGASGSDSAHHNGTTNGTMKNSAATNGNGYAPSNGGDATPFSLENIRYVLREHCETLRRLGVEHEAVPALVETFDRAVRRLNEILSELGETSPPLLEQLDADLGFVEEMLLEGMRHDFGAERLEQLRREGDRQLKSYRKGMGDEVYEQTLGNWVARRLREHYRVPRLSLFYLS